MPWWLTSATKLRHYWKQTIAELRVQLFLERDAQDDWRDLDWIGSVGRLMKGVCHSAFVGEVDWSKAIPI
ncbi:MAG: hypothetical protein JWP89_5442 [Schlesneria sp.]|nr:hypothetical protein [Schlesneria sp.]